MVLFGFVISCKKDDDDNIVQLRDRNEQFITDSISIATFLDSHYVEVDSEFNVTFEKLTDGDGKESVRKQKTYPLQFNIVNVDEVNYKIYFLKIREGSKDNPRPLDSVLVSYKGNLLDKTRFEWRPNPFWTSALISGSINTNIFSTKGPRYILPEFKSGDYTENSDGTLNYNDFGVGVMFLPSGLAFFQNTIQGIPAYTPVVVTFNLYAVRYRDHDLDFVLTKDEDINSNYDYTDDDTDGDGIPNYLDADDDADGIPTKNEVKITFVDNVRKVEFLDDNKNGIPNHLDKEDIKEYNKEDSSEELTE
mgnify:CR=1 FL=1